RASTLPSPRSRTPPLIPYTTLFRSQPTGARRPPGARFDAAPFVEEFVEPQAEVPVTGHLGELRLHPVKRQCFLAQLNPPPAVGRSEEHTSELQSREKLVCRLLLEKN